MDKHSLEPSLLLLCLQLHSLDQSLLIMKFKQIKQHSTNTITNHPAIPHSSHHSVFSSSFLSFLFFLMYFFLFTSSFYFLSVLFNVFFFHFILLSSFCSFFSITPIETHLTTYRLSSASNMANTTQQNVVYKINKQ